MSNHPNATAGGLAGAIVTILVFVVGLLGVDVPAPVAAALVTVVATIVLAAGTCRRRDGGA